MARDFIGQELKEGDKVVCIQHYKTSSNFKNAYVKKLSDKTALLNPYAPDGNEDFDFRKSFDKIIKISENKLLSLLEVRYKYQEDFEPLGLFSSEEAMEDAKARYLKQQRNMGLDPSGYEFTHSTYAIDVLY